MVHHVRILIIGRMPLLVVQRPAVFNDLEVPRHVALSIADACLHGITVVHLAANLQDGGWRILRWARHLVLVAKTIVARYPLACMRRRTVNQCLLETTMMHCVQ
jgi:hypothetical protein